MLNDGPSFTASNGNGSGQMGIKGSSMGVELVGERVPGLLSGVEVRDEGKSAPVVPGMPGLRREPEMKNEEERVPNLQRGGEGVNEEAEHDDDDWTVVGDEDGDEEVVRRPPPSYEDATRR